MITLYLNDTVYILLLVPFSLVEVLILGEYKMCSVTVFVESLVLWGQIRLSHPSPLQQCDEDPVLQMDKNIGQYLKKLKELLLCHVAYLISCNAYNLGRIDLVCWVQDSVAIFHCAFDSF